MKIKNPLKKTLILVVVLIYNHISTSHRYFYIVNGTWRVRNLVFTIALLTVTQLLNDLKVPRKLTIKIRLRRSVSPPTMKTFNKISVSSLAGCENQYIFVPRD